MEYMKYIALAILGCLLSFVVRAEESYVLYESEMRGVGLKWMSKHSTHCNNSEIKVLDEGEQLSVFSQVVDRVIESVSVSEILSPTELKVKYIEHTGTTKWDDEGDTEETVDVSPLKDVDFVVRYRFGQWNHVLGKEEWTEKQLQELNLLMAGMNAEKGFYGVKKRKVGDRWKVGAKDWYGSTLQWKKVGGEVSVHFLKVVEYKGQKCAVLKVNGDVEGIALDEELLTKIRGEETIYRDLTHLADVYIESEIQWRSEGSVEGQKIEISFTLNSTSDSKLLATSD